MKIELGLHIVSKKNGEKGIITALDVHTPVSDKPKIQITTDKAQILTTESTIQRWWKLDIEEPAKEEVASSNDEKIDDEEVKEDQDVNTPSVNETAENDTKNDAEQQEQQVAIEEPAQEEEKVEKPTEEVKPVEVTENKPAPKKKAVNAEKLGFYNTVAELLTKWEDVTTKSTSQYLGLWINKKVFAQLTNGRKNVYAIIYGKALSEEDKKNLKVYPKSFGWVLDTKVDITPDNINEALELIKKSYEYRKNQSGK